ncbi:MAG: DUF2442 domain-containing protein [Candidatus Thiosymbion ectosymbiont of Robbea hypermnestra]|nr:DUF2442 domain-containing protein [Candidatus Thiosymbion ectosymbiont of Robbea hypermnestra]
MKLQSFQNTGFEFSLLFANGEIILVDLQPLIGAYISEEDLVSAQIDPDWGCLEFRNGAIDIDPTTLHRYATHYRD